MRFIFPSGWLVETPSITENGEAGNIGANNYVKGDSANFAALPIPSGESFDTLTKNKEFFKGWLSSQMSNDVYAKDGTGLNPLPAPWESHREGGVAGSRTSRSRRSSA